jgi:hypothetical protein
MFYNAILIFITYHKTLAPVIGKDGVGGSIPLGSTMKRKGFLPFGKILKNSGAALVPQRGLF